MIIKDSVFAQAGKQEVEKTEADFRAGMIPNTVAKAEDVNTYGYMSDRDLKVVCDEIVNALKAEGITPNGSYNTEQATQLRDLLTTKLGSGIYLTGIDRTTFTTAPTQSGNTITFSQFDVVFNTGVYYGNTQAQRKRVTLKPQTVSATSMWGDGVHYLYLSIDGALMRQGAPVLGADGATKCLLGSLFVVNGQIQANSWKFQPWLMPTSIERRQIPTAGKKGGIITPLSGMQIQMGAVEVLEEGINFANDPNTPSIATFGAASPFTFKLLYPGYNASAAAYTDLTYASTHVYMASSNSMQDISTSHKDKYICLVPCIVPTGQTLMVPAMVASGSSLDAAVFDSIEAARAAVYGLKYATGTTTRRCIYLGQTLIVRVGATDLTDPNQFATEGIVPAALAGFTEASGQTGGGAGQYIPMKSVTHPVALTVTFENNAVNIITPNTSNVTTINVPTPVSGQVNQAEIHYAHTSASKGLSFVSQIKWWGTAPTFTAGYTYNIILEYVNGAWRAGYLSMAS